MRRWITGLGLLVVGLPAWAANPWGSVHDPAPGTPEVIGSYAAGCVAGAERLPLSGDGFQVMRPSRNRYYGHPTLVSFVEHLGQQVAQRGWGRLLVGDLAQPRGGPMEFGHRSHQSGLDVDIWLRLLPPSAGPLTRKQTEAEPMLSVIKASAGTMHGGRWSARLGELIKLAARAPEVERIFVNPVIKQALCRSAGGDRSWLRKVRPWWGHDAHFHVRLACPPDNPRCYAQDSVEPGDGCDASLASWVKEIRQAAARPAGKHAAPPEPLLPSACSRVLAGKPTTTLGALSVPRGRRGDANETQRALGRR